VDHEFGPIHRRNKCFTLWWGSQAEQLSPEQLQGLHHSPELPALPSRERQARRLPGSRGNCGLFWSTDSVAKGAQRPQTPTLLLVLPEEVEALTPGEDQCCVLHVERAIASSTWCIV